ncbi:MAG: hypothetical protein IKR53_03045 [Clostridia bacterium]|nr:hypothetical protein [Clostridia bacterium]
MKIVTEADVSALRRITRNFDGARRALCEAVLESSEPYVPYDTGFLLSTGSAEADRSGVTYGAPYARRMYYHTGSFSKRVHRLAGPKWVERAKDASSGEWERAVLGALLR